MCRTAAARVGPELDLMRGQHRANMSVKFQRLADALTIDDEADMDEHDECEVAADDTPELACGKLLFAWSSVSAFDKKLQPGRAAEMSACLEDSSITGDGNGDGSDHLIKIATVQLSVSRSTLPQHSFFLQTRSLWFAVAHVH